MTGLPTAQVLLRTRFTRERESLRLSQYAKMHCLRGTMGFKILTIWYLLAIMCEACVKYVPPPEKQCVPCNKNEEERSRGSIWNQMYGGNFEEISESKSPRFNLPVVTICCETTTTAEPTTGMGTSRLQNATGGYPHRKI